MKAMIIGLGLLVSVSTTFAIDFYINGKQVEVDRIELITNDYIPPVPGDCPVEEREYDWYDLDQDGRYVFGGAEFCYDPCNYQAGAVVCTD